MKQRLYALIVLMMILSCDSKDAKIIKPKELPMVESHSPTFYKSHEPKKANAPFSDVVQVGNLFFLSGQIGMDQKERTLVSGGIEAETKQTLENIKDVLAHHNLEMKNVVKAMVVLDDIEDFAAFNAIYTTYFPQKPARTTFAAEALAAGAKIEIEVIAVKSE